MQLSMTTTTTDWKDTVLWSAIQGTTDAHAPAVVALLTRWMPGIQTVIASGGTSPRDFTLHDAGHSFRVAQRMVEIVPADVLPNLSSYELALLLLSAYLHDIGMTPEQRKVLLHHQFLLTGVSPTASGLEKGTLSDQEIADLQRWLDDDTRSVTLPISQGPPTPDDLQLANELTTYYCRYRHNDWSADWIRNFLDGEDLGTYTGWIDDLVRLCQSHHWGKRQLLEHTFDPRPVGSPSAIIHLRYLACVLRIADILEFDPERTPEVILRHRDIAPASMIYWYKDHEISMVREANRIVISARPSNARVHRAVEMMLDEIDYELQLCRWLADETHFENCPGLNNKLPHRWDWQASMHRDLEPRNRTYEYIDGAFRPNTRKLLQLLSGIELYGHPLVAVRELIQNAFDAVREQIAYQRLARPNPVAPDLETTLGKLHCVELRLESTANGTWLICTDSGVGMTKAIINNHLLVSGQARRHDVLALERRCKLAGFELGRTGQFGIGVLSYFMLADGLKLQTRRSLEAGDGDATGWCFETEGVGSFGELRQDTNLTRGSRVEIHLRPQICRDPVEFFSQLRGYLQNIVAFAPCDLVLNSPLPECPSVSLGLGWIVDRQELISRAISTALQARTFSADDVPIELLPDESRQQRQQEEQERSQVAEEALRCLKWHERTGQLPNGLGRFRLTLPYFDLPQGASLGFLRVRESPPLLHLKSVSRGNLFRLALHPRISWKGMQIATSRRVGQSPAFSSVLAEIDFENDKAGTVHVARDAFSESDEVWEAIYWLQHEAKMLLEQFVMSNRTSTFAWLNRRMAGLRSVTSIQPNWVAISDTSVLRDTVWKSISFPATTSLSWAYGELQKVTWNGKPVDVVRCLGGPGDVSHYDGLAWIDVHDAPDRIVVIDSYRPVLIPLWTKTPQEAADGMNGVFPTCLFPSSWKSVCGVAFPNYAAIGRGTNIWNRRYPLVRTVTPDSWSWAKQVLAKPIDPVSMGTELLSDKTRAAAWLLHLVQLGRRELWLGARERDSTFVRALWKLLFPKQPSSVVCLWIDGPSSWRLRVVGSDGWATYKERGEIVRWMPDPGLAWRLESTSTNAQVESRRILQSELALDEAVVDRKNHRKAKTFVLRHRKKPGH